MNKISEVFNLNEPIGYPVSWSDDQVRAGNKAIRNIDAIADALDKLLDEVAGDSIHNYLSEETCKAHDAGIAALKAYRGEK